MKCQLKRRWYIIPIELSFRTYITFLNAPGLGRIGWNAPTGSVGTTNQQKALGKLSDHKRYTVRSVVIKNCYISIYKFDFPQRNVAVFTSKCNLQLLTIWWGNDSAGSYLTREIHSTKPEIEQENPQFLTAKKKTESHGMLVSVTRSGVENFLGLQGRFRSETLSPLTLGMWPPGRHWHPGFWGPHVWPEKPSTTNGMRMAPFFWWILNGEWWSMIHCSLWWWLRMAFEPLWRLVFFCIFFFADCYYFDWRKDVSLQVA